MRDMAVSGVYSGSVDCHVMVRVAESALKE